MDSLFFLIPLSLVILGVAVLAFRWAIRSGQYDDLERSGHSILFDDDDHMIPKDQETEKSRNCD